MISGVPMKKLVLQRTLKIKVMKTRIPHIVERRKVLKKPVLLIFEILLAQAESLHFAV